MQPSVSGIVPKERAIARPTLVALGVASTAILAAAFAFVMPPFQVPDEHAHFVRAYQLSKGQIVAAPETRVAANVLEFLLRYSDAHELWRKSPPLEGLTALTSADNTEVSIYKTERQPWLLSTVAAAKTYFPLVYAPGGAVLWGLRHLGASPPVLLYGSRLANVAVFVAALAVAVHLVGHYRALLFAIALMPMTLQQIGSISADAPFLALTVLGVALMMWARERSLSSRQVVLLGAYFVLWALCKFNLWILALPWVALAGTYRPASRRLLRVAVILLAGVLAAAAWQHLNAVNVDGFRLSRLAGGVDTDLNVQTSAQHPELFIMSLVRSIQAYGSHYLGGFVGKFGWSQMPPPKLVRVLYLAVLVVAALTVRLKSPLRISEKIFLAAIAVAGSLQVIVVLILYCAEKGLIQSGHAVWGVQGRYFIPTALTGLVTLHGNLRMSPELVEKLVIAVAWFCALWCLTFVWHLYYQ